MTMPANFQSIANMIAAMLTIIIMPHVKSTSPHANISASRSQSDVSRAISQPTGL